jgi:hypothetical protein
MRLVSSSEQRCRAWSTSSSSAGMPGGDTSPTWRQSENSMVVCAAKRSVAPAMAATWIKISVAGIMIDGRAVAVRLMDVAVRVTVGRAFRVGATSRFDSATGALVAGFDAGGRLCVGVSEVNEFDGDNAMSEREVLGRRVVAASAADASGGRSDIDADDCNWLADTGAAEDGEPDKGLETFSDGGIRSERAKLRSLSKAVNWSCWGSRRVSDASSAS